MLGKMARSSCSRPGSEGGDGGLIDLASCFQQLRADNPQWNKRKADKTAEASRKASRMSKQSKRQLFDINDDIVVAPKKAEKLSSISCHLSVLYMYLHNIQSICDNEAS